DGAGRGEQDEPNVPGHGADGSRVRAGGAGGAGGNGGNAAGPSAHGGGCRVDRSGHEVLRLESRRNQLPLRPGNGSPTDQVAGLPNARQLYTVCPSETPARNFLRLGPYDDHLRPEGVMTAPALSV